MFDNIVPRYCANVTEIVTFTLGRLMSGDGRDGIRYNSFLWRFYLLTIKHRDTQNFITIVMRINLVTRDTFTGNVTLEITNIQVVTLRLNYYTRFLDRFCVITELIHRTYLLH